MSHAAYSHLPAACLRMVSTSASEGPLSRSQYRQDTSLARKTRRAWFPPTDGSLTRPVASSNPDHTLRGRSASESLSFHPNLMAASRQPHIRDMCHGVEYESSLHNRRGPSV